MLFLATGFLNAQEFKNHKVARGETLESIAAQYEITAADIVKFNPEAKNGSFILEVRRY